MSVYLRRRFSVAYAPSREPWELPNRPPLPSFISRSPAMILSGSLMIPLNISSSWLISLWILTAVIWYFGWRNISISFHMVSCKLCCLKSVQNFALQNCVSSLSSLSVGYSFFLLCFCIWLWQHWVHLNHCISVSINLPVLKNCYWFWTNSVHQSIFGEYSIMCIPPFWASTEISSLLLLLINSLLETWLHIIMQASIKPKTMNSTGCPLTVYTPMHTKLLWMSICISSWNRHCWWMKLRIYCTLFKKILSLINHRWSLYWQWSAVSRGTILNLHLFY